MTFQCKWKFSIRWSNCFLCLPHWISQLQLIFDQVSKQSSLCHCEGHIQGQPSGFVAASQVLQPLVSWHEEACQTEWQNWGNQLDMWWPYLHQQHCQQTDKFYLLQETCHDCSKYFTKSTSSSFNLILTVKFSCMQAWTILHRSPWQTTGRIWHGSPPKTTAIPPKWLINFHDIPQGMIHTVNLVHMAHHNFIP